MPTVGETWAGADRTNTAVSSNFYIFLTRIFTVNTVSWGKFFFCECQCAFYFLESPLVNYAGSSLWPWSRFIVIELVRSFFLRFYFLFCAFCKNILFVRLIFCSFTWLIINRLKRFHGEMINPGIVIAKYIFLYFSRLLLFLFSGLRILSLGRNLTFPSFFCFQFGRETDAVRSRALSCAKVCYANSRRRRGVTDTHKVSESTWPARASSRRVRASGNSIATAEWSSTSSSCAPRWVFPPGGSW